VLNLCLYVTVCDSGRYDEVLSELFTQLWDCDVNRCEPGYDYSLDLQGIIGSSVITFGTRPSWITG